MNCDYDKSPLAETPCASAPSAAGTVFEISGRKVCGPLQSPILGTSIAGSIVASRRQACADSEFPKFGLDAHVYLFAT